MTFSTALTNTTTFAVGGKQMNLAEYQQYLADQTSPEKIRANAQQQAADRLQQTKDLWKVGFDQRQQEADVNATRAAGYRKEESERDFGQRTAFSGQDFTQNRTLQGDYLGSQEKRETAQIAARERMQESGFGQDRDMASLRSNLKQREKSEDRSAAIAAFRNKR